MASVTLATLTTRAMARADMDNGGVFSFVSPSLWTQWINDSAYELWDLLVALYDDELVQLSAVLTTTTPNVETYSLDSNFHKLSGIDIQTQSGSWQPLLPIPNFRARNNYRNAQGYTARDLEMRYWLRGTPAVLHILPIPLAAFPLKVWYVPEFTPFVNPTDAFNFGNGWDEYVVVCTAMRAVAKEEGDVSELMAAKAALVERINESAPNRDEGSPGTIGDVTNDSIRLP